MLYHFDNYYFLLLFLTENETLREKEVKRNQDYKYITIVTDTNIVEKKDINEIIPTGKFKT